MRHWRTSTFFRIRRSPLRNRPSWLAAAVALVLTITLADFPGQPAAAAPIPAAPLTAQVKTPCPTDKADEPSAAIAAKLCDGRVEVVNRRTETTRVFVNPNGTLTQEQALAPVR